MLKKLTTAAVLLGLTLVGGAGKIKPDQNLQVAAYKATKEKPEEKESPSTTVKRWTLPNGTASEQRVLEFFQERGITDRAALATLLGNIKQESLFVTNICEGGARVAYQNCHRGGYGLIQWTTTGRYDGLGRHARNIGGDPSSLETQLSYLVTEREWREVEGRFKSPGGTINSYMRAAYWWLGWGIHGNRTHYSHQYYNALTM